MKKIITILSLLFITINVNAQKVFTNMIVENNDTIYWYKTKPMWYDEMGFVFGANKIGINPKGIQPIYGITLQQQFGRFLNVEGNVSYIQVQTRHPYATHTIRDYLNFMILAKPGFYSKKGGAFIVYGFSINPSLNHNNIENHTYTSFNIGGGTQFNVTQRKIIELKLFYSCGLQSGYMVNGEWQDFYNGTQFMLTFKRKTFCEEIRFKSKN